MLIHSQFFFSPHSFNYNTFQTPNFIFFHSFFYLHSSSCIFKPGVHKLLLYIKWDNSYFSFNNSYTTTFHVFFFVTSFIIFSCFVFFLIIKFVITRCINIICREVSAIRWDWIVSWCDYKIMWHVRCLKTKIF